MMYDLQIQVTYTIDERRQIKQHFEKYEFTKLRKFNRLSNFDQEVFPKSVIRQILSCMRNDDGYQSYLLMAFMNKELQELAKQDQSLKTLSESYRDKERMKLLNRVHEIDQLKQMKWFFETDFDFKTTSYIRDSQGKVVHQYPKKTWKFLSQQYQADTEERYYRTRPQDDQLYSTLEYRRLVRYRQERKKKREFKKYEDFDNYELMFEDEQEREERYESIDSNHAQKSKRNIREKQVAEMEFQESLFGLYRILFGNPNQYSLNKRKKQFVMLMTYVLFDPNDKQLNDKLVPFYCIFPEHLEYQIIIQDIGNRYGYFINSRPTDPPMMAIYNKVIYRLEEFLVKYPGFQQANSFQQNYTMLLFKTKAFDKCIDFIVQNKMIKLPSAVASAFENFREQENTTFNLKEFWYPLFQRLDCNQLSNISYQVSRAAFDRDDIASLKYYNQLYNLLRGTVQSAEVLHRIGDIVKYSVSKEEFVQYNLKAIGVNPKCSSAYSNLAKYYMDNSQTEDFIKIMEPYCLLQDKGQYILEAIEKFQNKVSHQWLAKAVQLYRQTSFQTIQRAFDKVEANILSKIDYMTQRPLESKILYIMALVRYESANIQYILAYHAYKKFISDQLIYKQELSHLDLFFD